MRIKTSELTGPALDWAASIAEGFKPSQLYIQKWGSMPASIYTRTFDEDGNADGFITGPARMYSCKWEAGGPIIEREGISIVCAWHISAAELGNKSNPWQACLSNTMKNLQRGQTPLIAVMRCYVASKLGDTVDVPDELTL